jgi:hypothetical protein
MFKFTKIAILLFFLFSLDINYVLAACSGPTTANPACSSYVNSSDCSSLGASSGCSWSGPASTGDATPVKNDLKFTPQVTVGTFKTEAEGGKVGGYEVSASTETIGQYIKQIYQYAIGIVAILAVVVMMIGGVLWMTAGGNTTQISSARSWISGSLLGLLLVMSSYVILKTVNPDLVNFKIHTIPAIPLSTASNSSNGCCVSKSSDVTSLSGWKITACVQEKIESCPNANMSETVVMATNDRNFWYGTPCDQVKGCSQYNPQSLGTNDCTSVADGTDCTNGYCYDGVCRIVTGSTGAKCGPVGNIGTCQSYSVSSCTTSGLCCPATNPTWISSGGGSCTLLLHCCK